MRWDMVQLTRDLAWFRRVMVSVDAVGVSHELFLEKVRPESWYAGVHSDDVA